MPWSNAEDRWRSIVVSVVWAAWMKSSIKTSSRCAKGLGVLGYSGEASPGRSGLGKGL